MRAYRLALARCDSACASALDRALSGAGRRRAPARRARSEQAEGAAEVARSLVGALARMPGDELAALVALLELVAPGRLLLATAGARLERQWRRRVGQLRGLTPTCLQLRFLLALRARLEGRQAGSAPGLEGLAAQLVEALGPVYRVPEALPLTQRFQSILCAASLEAWPCGSVAGCARRLARSSLARLAWQTGLVACASAALGATRRRVAVTLAAMMYVLGGGLLGVTLAFDVYRWIAVAVEALTHPAALAWGAAGGTGVLYARRRRSLDLRLAAWSLSALYCGLPPGSPA